MRQAAPQQVHILGLITEGHRKEHPFWGLPGRRKPPGGVDEEVMGGGLCSPRTTSERHTQVSFHSRFLFSTDNYSLRASGGLLGWSSSSLLTSEPGTFSWQLKPKQ